MRTCYDESKYVKGKRIYRVKDVQIGKEYIFVSTINDTAFMALVLRMELEGFDYSILDAYRYKLNGFDYHMWDYMLEPRKVGKLEIHSFEVYEAVEPAFTCKHCKSHDVPVPISAVQVINGQRIGYSCNYWRCECGTINRHVWNSGYPTRYELTRESSK